MKRKFISIIIAGVSLFPVLTGAAELRAGLYRYDGGAGLYAMQQSQQLICDNCPRTPPLVAAPPVFAAGFNEPEKTSPPPPIIVEKEQPAESSPEPTCHKQSGPVATVLFRFDSSRLRESEMARLKQAVKKIATPVVVLVDGYTCRIGARKYNVRLSARRAKVVAAYLRKIGVKVAGVEGHGTSKPLGGNIAKDRRAEILITEG